MNFKSLNESQNRGFIKSLPILKQLDLTANEIFLIELALHYQRLGTGLYMNYKNIANYLVIDRTKPNFVKVVGNITNSLKKKGYILKNNSSNYNGYNGGSSTQIIVDEEFIEFKLREAFSKNALELETSNPIEATADEVEDATFNNDEELNCKSVTESNSFKYFFEKAKVKYAKLYGIEEKKFDDLARYCEEMFGTMDHEELKTDRGKNYINTQIDYPCLKSGGYVKLKLL